MWFYAQKLIFASQFCVVLFFFIFFLSSQITETRLNLIHFFPQILLVSWFFCCCSSVDEKPFVRCVCFGHSQSYRRHPPLFQSHSHQKQNYEYCNLQLGWCFLVVGIRHLIQHGVYGDTGEGGGCPCVNWAHLF